MLKIFSVVLVLVFYVLSSCVRDENPTPPEDTISDDDVGDIVDAHTNEQDGTQLDIFDLDEDPHVDTENQNPIDCNPFREECLCDHLRYSLCCVVGTETVYECIDFWVLIEDTTCEKENATTPCFPDR